MWQIFHRYVYIVEAVIPAERLHETLLILQHCQQGIDLTAGVKLELTYSVMGEQSDSFQFSIVLDSLTFLYGFDRA